jgi:hypothetical protein
MTFPFSSELAATALSILCDDVEKLRAPFVQKAASFSRSTGLFQAVSIGLSRRSALRTRSFFNQSILLGRAPPISCLTFPIHLREELTTVVDWLKRENVGSHIQIMAAQLSWT